MPRIGKIPGEQKELAAQIRAQFGGAFVLTQKQVGQILGHRSKETTRHWLETLTPRIYNDGGRKKRYLVQDVVKKMVEGEA